MKPLTLDIMKRRWVHGNQHIPGLMEGIVNSSAKVFEKYGLDSNLTVAHAMAQFSEECGEGLEMIESLNYTAQRLLQIFPTHFSVSMANKYAHNQQMIGEIAYGGRMGNKPPPSTDGFDYRGRGLSQVTGKGDHGPGKDPEGYTALNIFLKKNGADFDILQHPELLSDPDHTLECGVADYILCGCLPFAKKDDIVNETKRLNGGLNGLSERRRELALWKKEFGL